MPPPLLPVPFDPRRLAAEEVTLRRDLAALEARIREFEDGERPAYDAWLRVALGPAFAALGEASEALRARSMVAERVGELVEMEGLHPREALYLVTEGAMDAWAGRDDGEREEIEARRRAKRERKRAARREARRGSRAGRDEGTPDDAAAVVRRRRIATLYRALARRLHPDSATAIAGLDHARVQAVWLEVQGAYGARSLERLLAISAWLESESETAPDAPERAPSALLSVAERHERLRALRRARRTLLGRLAELEREPGWGFARASTRTRRDMKQTATRTLAAELARVQAALREVDEQLASIGPPRPPRAGRRR